VKAKANRTKCINNIKQLATAWHLYMVDNADRMVANGYGVPEDTSMSGGKTNRMWVMGDEHNYPTAFVNHDYLTNPEFALFAQYKISSEVYKCPADRSTREIGGVKQSRLRNYALNIYFGWTYPATPLRVGKNDLLDGLYKTFLKEADMDGVNPSKLFTFVDTSPVSVCYPAYVPSFNPFGFFHRPSVEHDRYPVFAFADSHVETPHFLNKQTIDLAHTPTASGPSPDPAWADSTGSPDGDHAKFIFTGTSGNLDMRWIRERASAQK
jgi:hypothetical protein